MYVEQPSKLKLFMFKDLLSNIQVIGRTIDGPIKQKPKA